jgi:processing peptidase subunit alpha
VQKDPTELDLITTLPNGLRVATEALPGPFSGIGIYVDAGSRYENDRLRGVSHIVDRLAFKSTASRNEDQMMQDLEMLGGNIHCASSREALMYQCATFNSAASTAVGILADTIRNARVTEEEVAQQLDTADYEIGEIWDKPELILPELVHMAAYKDNTLGNPLLCPRERLDEIDKSVVEEYRSTFFKPERMVLALAGLRHDEAVRLAEKYFGDMTNDFTTTSVITSSPNRSSSTKYSTSSPSSSLTYSPPSSQSNILSKIPFMKNISTSAAPQASVQSFDPFGSPGHQTSHYTGGYLSLPPIPPPANVALPRLSYVHIAFEALPISSPDIYALATLQTLLGGGGSFSAGGPGKGMYSRVYTNVLNQHGWVESCMAFNNSYTDSGLFGMSASCSPQMLPYMIDVICRELFNLTTDSGFASLQPGEVQRAKNQLRSSVLMNLESRMVELEDLGRQVQVHGRKIGVREMCDQIEALTIEDLRRVARTILSGEVINPGGGSGRPTVVVQEGEQEGRVLKQITWEEIQDRISRWKLGRAA